MKLVALDMPDNHEELPQWLERQLVGPNLRELVAQLTVIHQGAPLQGEFNEVFKGKRSRILEAGLSALEQHQITALLTNPKLLLDMQIFVFSRGGSFWEQLLEDSPGQLSDGFNEQLFKKLTGQNVQATNDLAEPTLSTNTNSPATKTQNQIKRKKSRPWVSNVISALLAASIVVALFSAYLFYFQTSGTSQIAFFSELPAATSVDEKIYLASFNTDAQKWFDYQPQSAEQLKSHILNLVDGCDRVIAGDHDALDQQTKSWLVEKCSAWRNNFVNKLVAVNREPAKYAQIRSEMDAAVRKMIKTVDTKIEELG